MLVIINSSQKTKLDPTTTMASATNTTITSASPCPSPVSNVIFDLDGTLIDSERYFLLALADILNQYDAVMDTELRSKTIGLFVTVSAPIIVDHLKLPITPEEFIQLVLARYKRYVLGEIDGKGVTFLPGAERLVAHFARHKVPMALCTGSMKVTYDYKVSQFGDYFQPGKYFRHIVVAHADPEVARNKPAPDPYLVCIDRFNKHTAEGAPPVEPPVKPNSVLAFEDSPTGLRSALAAGCQCVLVQPNTKIDEYCEKNKIWPTQRLHSLEDFQPELFGLPPFDQQ